MDIGGEEHEKRWFGVDGGLLGKSNILQPAISWPAMLVRYRQGYTELNEQRSPSPPPAPPPLLKLASWGEPMWGGFGWVRLAFGVSPHQMDWPALGYAKYAHVGETVLGQVCPGTDREPTHTHTVGSHSD